MPQYHVEAMWQVIQTHTIEAPNEERVWELLKEWKEPCMISPEDTCILDMRDTTITPYEEN